MHHVVLLAARVTLLLAITGGCVAPRIDEEAVTPFIEQAAQRPEYVGAGFVNDGRLLLVTVHGNPEAMRLLAQTMLPQGVPYEIRELDHSLAELNALAERVRATEFSGQDRDPNITRVGVDELSGEVVIGVTVMSPEVVKRLAERYGPLIRVEVQAPIVFYG